MYNQPEEYQPGDLFWAKVGSHPWWPCMIYFTPDGEPYIRESSRKKSYHVQFLGPLVERAWLSISNMIPFTGKKNFDEYVQEKLSTCKDKTERAKFDAKSVSCSRKIWMQSWKEAESALNLTPKERVEKFGRITVKSKAALIDKAEEAELLKLMSGVPLTLEEESESLSNFLKEEMDVRLENHPEMDATVLENELRTQWPAFDISTKRRYLHNQLGIFEKFSKTANSEKTSRKSKEVAAVKMHELVKPSETSRTPSTKPKKSLDSRSKPQEHREFDVEIHRLIVSPAQYRLQPVCPVCEVYSNAPGLMFKCRGPCGRIMHPRCMRYKNPPPADNSRPEKFRCPQCLTGEFLCAICNKPAETGSKGGIGPLFSCQGGWVIELHWNVRIWSKVINCGRHFHRDCILGWPGILTRPSSTAFSSETATRSINFQLFRCPAHSCNTCHLELVDSDSNEASKRCFNEGALLQCVRCPAAFHTGDLCTPAGSVEVSLSHIVCPRHFDSNLISLPLFKTQHPSLCFHCSKSTPDRIECETCPMVYHKDCLQPSHGSLVDGKFTCRSCRLGVFPRYAQIVWAKINQFRWWPCEIIHARNAPINILNMAHPEGSFPVHFLGSDEYQWIGRSRVFPYELGLNKTVARDAHGSSKVEKAFTCSMKHAPRAHALYVNHVLRRGLPLFTMQAEKLPEEELLPQTSIDSNLAIDPVSDETQLSAILSSFTFIDKNDDPDGLLEKFQTSNSTGDSITPNNTLDSCSCFSTKKTCSAQTNCTHALSKVECEPNHCLYGDTDCGNRKFTLHTVPNHPTSTSDCTVAVIRTINRGYGLKSLIGLKQNDLILEYVGEVIDVNEANKRITGALGGSSAHQSRKIVQPLAETFLARLGPNNNLVLDAGSRGNLARFINHACEPNVYVECWIVHGVPRLGLFAKQEIKENDELTIDYLHSGFLSTGLMGTQSLCLCGADSCISTLRLPTTYQPYPIQPEVAEVPPERRKSSRKADELPVEDLSTIAPASPKSPSTPPPTAAKLVPEKPPISVTSLLAAAASQNRLRRDRALISPSSAASRASLSSKQHKQPMGKQNASEVSDMNGHAVSLRSPVHEDFCYRCGDGGELVLCDKTTCSKSFHLNCLGLASPPAGIWYCPWHYCDVCGHPSTHLCWRCPNSYCDQHATDTVIQIDELDTERWQLAQPGLNDITSPAIISSVRWICADHAGLKIYGPGYRPRLAEPELGTIAESNHPVTDTEIDKLGHNDEDHENVTPKSQESANEKPQENGNHETRRLEPLKVTLKRKLRAEMSSQVSDQDSSALDQNKTPTHSQHRKRASLAGSALDKKRPRLLREFPAK